MLYWEDVSNMNHYFYTAENPADGAAFTYHLSQPAQKVRLLVTAPNGRSVREVSASGSAGVIHRVNWDLRYPVPAGAGRGGGGGGGGDEGGGGGGPGRAGAVQLPVPPRDIGPRGPLVAPGMFTVALEVDGIIAEKRTFEVRADAALPYTAKDHKAREAYVLEVMDLQAKVDELAKRLSARRTTATTGSDSTRLQALEQRLMGGGVGGGRGGGGGGRGGGVQAIRQRVAGLNSTYMISGAQTGTMAPPTGAMRAALASVKNDLAAFEREMNAPAPSR
jgi:hypothetical protein